MGSRGKGEIMSNIKIRLAISIGSFIFFLLILELGLRFGGYIYIQKLLSENKVEAVSEQTHTILALGDSYTVGGNSKWEENYPSQLQKMLSEKRLKRACRPASP